MVWMPAFNNRSSMRGPMPHRRRTGSGARNAASVPGGTTTRPSGLRRSEAILATSLFAARPTEAVSEVAARRRSFRARAMASPGPRARRLPVTSRKASSIDRGSTRSVKPRRMAMTSADTAAYFSMSTPR